MVELTPHESSVLTRIIVYSRVPGREKAVEELSGDARKVGEVFLDPSKYSEMTDDVREAVDHFRLWLENNRRLREKRLARSRRAR
ncbi:hypothetical protein SBA4_1020007 [Candidatus Sulfopaludibacter sp. SbA4]|nr:hypothetical protein SBA4_1020007 [Candidatus Sulfopaludibacter sp. SbA4]